MKKKQLAALGAIAVMLFTACYNPFLRGLPKLDSNPGVGNPDGLPGIDGNPGSDPTDPIVNWPAGLTAVYGQTLANVTLPGNGSDTAGSFSWTAGGAASVGSAGTQTHNVTFTPTDTANYNILTQDVAVEVAKANPIVTWPTAESIVESDALSTSVLSGGTADVLGTFAWTDGTIIPPRGDGGYDVTFTPDDDANYNSLTEVVAITVTPTGNSIGYYWADGDGVISIVDGNGDELPGNIVTVQEGESITFKAGESGYTDHVWTLNGVRVGTNSTYTFSADNRQNTKNYIIGLMMVKNGKPHYTQITVYIEEN